MLFPRGGLLFGWLAAVGLWSIVGHEAGIIKDIYQKITHTNNKTEDTVKQSAPICGSGAFSTPDEKSLSPEIIFITNRPGKVSSSQYEDANGDREQQQQQQQQQRRSGRRGSQVDEVAREFRFHQENVTLAELERHGFNRDAPVSFLMHGFTSGYPLQAWISAIVEAYTIDQGESSPSGQSANYGGGGGPGSSDYQANQGDSSQRERERSRRIDDDDQQQQQRRRQRPTDRVKHNLFIVNWNYAARGILYPRAVANIPIVASYVTRFINDMLLGEARVEPARVQLIGHSLGAHLAGFIGKNTQSKLGRIYGLDPAGPCFGTISGPLYPASKRLAPGDADQVITIHTNTALLGLDRPIGSYSVYVEGGSVQPGCKGGGVLKSLQTLTWDGGDFDTVACSHSRAPNLFTYRHDQSDTQDDCQLVAYECKDWASFAAGHCGVCGPSNGGGGGGGGAGGGAGPSKSVECLRIGLDWQYPRQGASSGGGGGGGGGGSFTSPRPNNYDDGYNNNNYGSFTSRRPSAWNESGDAGQQQYSSTRRPAAGYQSTSGYGDEYSTRRPAAPANNYDGQYDGQPSGRRSTSRRPQAGYDNLAFDGGDRAPSRRPTAGAPSWNQRDRRDVAALLPPPPSSTGNSTLERKLFGSPDETKTLFLRTGDTQPYCAYQYQVILELSEPFAKRKPPMSILLQDSESGRNEQGGGRRRPGSSARRDQNSLSNDEFGNRFDDRTYTHLLTSGKKLGRVDHATLLFRDGLPDGMRLLKSLRVNYMSHIDPAVRRRLSTRLCPVRKDTNGQGQSQDFSTDKRFFFEPCTSDAAAAAAAADSDFNRGHSATGGQSNQANGRDRDGPTRRPTGGGGGSWE